jgi:prophage regulatory protein
MKRSVDNRALAPVDVAQRYTIAEATAYLRISHVSIYREINARRIRVLKQGRRTFVPGSEIARLSQLDQGAAAPATSAAAAKPDPTLTSSYRFLDSRIHQALMRDIAQQHGLWDAIQKLDRKFEHLTELIQKLVRDEPCREARVAESTASPQFLRLKEVMARVGLRVTTLYRYMTLGAFPRPRKFGNASRWVTAEVNDWIAQRTAGVPLEVDKVSSVPRA